MWRRPRLPAPDFLRPQRRPSPLPALWAATGLLVLAIAAGEALQAWQARSAALASAEAARWPAHRGGGAGRPAADSAGPARSVGRAGPVNPSAAPDAARPSAASGESARATTDPAQRDATRWRQRLAYPWPQVLAAAEAASVDGVAWLGLAHAQGGELRLDGRADRAETALDAAQALRSGPARLRWPEVQLARLDVVPDGQRFELLALPAEAAAGVAAPAGGRP